MSGDVVKHLVGAGDPKHTLLFEMVDKVADRVSDLMQVETATEALNVVQAMMIFCGSTLGRAHSFGVIDDDGLEKLKDGMIFNLSQAIEGGKDIRCDHPDHNRHIN